MLVMKDTKALINLYYSFHIINTSHGYIRMKGNKGRRQKQPHTNTNVEPSWFSLCCSQSLAVHTFFLLFSQMRKVCHSRWEVGQEVLSWGVC